jgi:hypothetical protein
MFCPTVNATTQLCVVAHAGFHAIQYFMRDLAVRPYMAVIMGPNGVYCTGQRSDQALIMHSAAT